MNETWVVLLCVAAAAGIGASPLASIDTLDPQGPRAKAMHRAEQQLAAAVLLAATAGLLSLWFYARAGEAWSPMLALLGIALPLVHPWLVVRFVLIPLGAPRMAYWVAKRAGHPWYRDPVGGAVLSAALAAMRRRKHDPELADWLRVRLHADRLGGAGIVGAALLAADAGDRETARAVLAGLDEIEPDICPPLARTIALDWLVADAARRGAWHELVERVSDDPFPTRTTRFIGLSARRMIGEGVGRSAVLWAWLRAPRRLRTLGLAWAAMRRPRIGTVVIDELELGALAANEAREPVLGALSLHAELAALPATMPLSAAVIERLAAAWDLALGDFGLRGDVRARAEALATGASGELLVARLQRAVARDLAGLVCQCGREAERLRGRSGILRRAREIHFEDVVEQLAQACSALGRRRTPELTPLSAWFIWVRLRRAYLVAAAPLERSERALLYGVVEQEVRQAAAWLWNERHERGLAHGVCLFLLAEAERVRDADAAAYYRHNVVVGL
jgi:hypothetical protein